MDGADSLFLSLFREYIRNPLIKIARENPEVEILVRKVKQGRAAVLRGHYGECLYERSEMPFRGVFCGLTLPVADFCVSI